VTRLGVQRQREMELREALRSMRGAIDDFKRLSDQGLIPVDIGTEGYPKTLEVLVEGVDLVGQVKKKRRFLRKIPVDPMTKTAEWGLRSYQDEPDARSWGGRTSTTSTRCPTGRPRQVEVQGLVR